MLPSTDFLNPHPAKPAPELPLRQAPAGSRITGPGDSGKTVPRPALQNSRVSTGMQIGTEL